MDKNTVSNTKPSILGRRWEQKAINKDNYPLIIVKQYHTQCCFYGLYMRHVHKIGQVCLIGKIKEILHLLKDKHLTNVYSNSLIKKNVKRLLKECRGKSKVCSQCILSSICSYINAHSDSYYIKSVIENKYRQPLICYNLVFIPYNTP